MMLFLPWSLFAIAACLGLGLAAVAASLVQIARAMQERTLKEHGRWLSERHDQQEALAKLRRIHDADKPTAACPRHSSPTTPRQAAD